MEAKKIPPQKKISEAAGTIYNRRKLNFDGESSVKIFTVSQ